MTAGELLDKLFKLPNADLQKPICFFSLADGNYHEVKSVSRLGENAPFVALLDEETLKKRFNVDG